MRKECLGSVTALLAGAGLGLAQPAPEPPVLASPAPHVRASTKSHCLPAELPPLTEPAGAVHSDPGLFPLPCAGLCETPEGYRQELPPYSQPEPRAAASKAECQDERCHVWVSGEPLLWWVRPGRTPPLLTTGGADGSLNYGMQVGGRLAAGIMNAANDLGLEATGFLLGRTTTHSGAVSGPDGAPALGRPVNDALLRQSALVAVSTPGALAGALAVASSTQLWGAEANVVSSACGSDHFGIDLVGGLRYLTLEEGLALSQSGTVLAGGAATFGGVAQPPQASFVATDSFRTRNEFVGGQLGSQVEMRWGRLYTHVLGKVAVGNVHQVVDVRGDTTAAGGTGPATLPGGVLALGSNSGRQTHDEFGVLPELNLNVGYEIRPGLRLYAGYTCLYLNDVTRPGDQINTTINPAQVPISPQYGSLGGPAQPTPLFNHSDFWTQGINVGLALRY
jgi:hypothetical protein